MEQTKNSIFGLAFDLRFIQIGTQITYKQIIELREYIILAEQLEHKDLILSGDFEMLNNFVQYVDTNVATTNSSLVEQICLVANGKNKRAFAVLKTDEDVSIMQSAVLIYLKMKGVEYEQSATTNI